MNTEELLDLGARGVHLLFETGEIEAAFERDASDLREEIAGRHGEVQQAIAALMELDDVDEGRALVDSLDDAIRHVLVLIYFDLLDSHARRFATLQ